MCPIWNNTHFLNWTSYVDLSKVAVPAVMIEAPAGRKQNSSPECHQHSRQTVHAGTLQPGPLPRYTQPTKLEHHDTFFSKPTQSASQQQYHANRRIQE